MAKETDTLLDHDFDGIREYDNPLPRWWLWLFYGTILFAVIYFPYYGLGWGPSSGDMYEEELALAPKAAPALSAPAGAPATAGTPGAPEAGGAAQAMASLEGDPAAIEAGAKIFATTCMPCHGDKGQGLIGPNLTDKYWLHGNTYGDVVKTITDGVPDKGMIAWKAALNPTKIAQAAAFVLSLQGSTPPNPKAPQGQEYP